MNLVARSLAMMSWTSIPMIALLRHVMLSPSHCPCWTLPRGERISTAPTGPNPKFSIVSLFQRTTCTTFLFSTLSVAKSEVWCPQGCCPLDAWANQIFARMGPRHASEIRSLEPKSSMVFILFVHQKVLEPKFQKIVIRQNHPGGLGGFVAQMHPIYLQSDCSGAEGAYFGLHSFMPSKVHLLSSILAFLIQAFVTFLLTFIVYFHDFWLFAMTLKPGVTEQWAHWSSSSAMWSLEWCFAFTRLQDNALK